MVWPCSSVFRVSSSLTRMSSFTMFSWPTLRPAPFSTSLLRFEISSFSWFMVSFARTESGREMRSRISVASGKPHLRDIRNVQPCCLAHNFKLTHPAVWNGVRSHETVISGLTGNSEPLSITDAQHLPGRHRPDVNIYLLSRLNVVYTFDVGCYYCRSDNVNEVVLLHLLFRERRRPLSTPFLSLYAEIRW